MKKIVFTGGGTLGHVMPNLYLMEELKKYYDCFYVGSSGIEKEKLKDFSFPYYNIPTSKFVRGKILINFKIPFVLLKSILLAKKILKEIKPDVIFSKGGYVALPVCIAGRMLKIPIVAHESDYSFGLANKIILKTCKTMCVNFKNIEGRNKKVVYTGPIFSKRFEENSKDYSKLNINKNLPTILIVGGSLGSQKINNAIFAILKDLLKNFNVIHITGKGNNRIKSYDNYNAFEMIDDIVNLYNIADFVIGRSGAGVTAECYYKKLPMILIPLQNKSSRGDQMLNAQYYEKQGVAKIIKENDLTPTLLFNEINIFYKIINKYKNNCGNAEIINGKTKIIELINKIKK